VTGATVVSVVVPSAGAAAASAGAASVGATVVSVVAGACSAGVFFEQVKPVVNAKAIKAADTISFILLPLFYLFRFVVCYGFSTFSFC
jgi:hypothetical protein